MIPTISLVFTLILGAISMAELLLGDRATFVVSFLTGLFELHGVSYANATMHSQQQLSFNAATFSILVAVNASFFAKLSAAWIIHRGAFSRWMGAIFIPMGVVIVLVAWLSLSFA